MCLYDAMIFANENNGSGSVYCAVLYDSCILEYCVTIEKESFATKIKYLIIINNYNIVYKLK